MLPIGVVAKKTLSALVLLLPLSLACTMAAPSGNRKSLDLESSTEDGNVALLSVGELHANGTRLFSAHISLELKPRQGGCLADVKARWSAVEPYQGDPEQLTFVVHGYTLGYAFGMPGAGEPPNTYSDQETEVIDLSFANSDFQCDQALSPVGTEPVGFNSEGFSTAAEPVRVALKLNTQGPQASTSGAGPALVTLTQNAPRGTPTPQLAPLFCIAEAAEPEVTQLPGPNEGSISVVEAYRWLDEAWHPLENPPVVKKALDGKCAEGLALYPLQGGDQGPTASAPPKVGSKSLEP